MRIVRLVSIDDAIEFLNQLAKIDAFAIRVLIERRIVCNHKMAEHPTVQVDVKENHCFVGFLGVLNGLFGITEDGWGHIMAIYQDDGSVSFCRTEEWLKSQ